MGRSQKKISAGSAMMLSLVLVTAIALEQGFISSTKWYNVLYVTLPLLLILYLVSRYKKAKTTTAAQD